jgi:hypothetical protein
MPTRPIESDDDHPRPMLTPDLDVSPVSSDYDEIGERPPPPLPPRDAESSSSSSDASVDEKDATPRDMPKKLALPNYKAGTYDTCEWKVQVNPGRLATLTSTSTKLVYKVTPHVATP